MFLYNTFYGCGQVVPSHRGKSLGRGLAPPQKKYGVTHR